MNIYDLISRAQQLRKETKLDSVSPDRVGALCEDMLKYINEFQLLASAPSLHKIYASVSAMQLDGAPQSDLTGKALKPGQLVVIVPESQTDATAGDVYRYDGPSGNTSAWTFVAKIGGVPADADLNASSTNPVQNKVVTEKLTELSEENERLKERIEEQDVFIEDLEYHKLTANSDNRYPELSVGTADNLAGVDVVDSEINFRRSGGGAITDGVARIESIKGNSVVWNQLRDVAIKSFTTTKASITLELTQGSNIIKLSGIYDGTTGDLNYYITNSFPSITGVVGHKYLCTIRGNKNIQMSVYGAVNPAAIVTSSIIVTCSTEEAINLIPRIMPTLAEGTEINEEVSFYCTDLTQMFGAGNEPSTIEEFYARIPMGVDMNTYNEGEVIHMDVQSIESQGVNAWDEEWEKGRLNTTTGIDEAQDGTLRMVNKVAVLPNSTYYCLSPVDAWTLFYDKDGNVIEGYSTGRQTNQNACNIRGVSFVTPPNASYMRTYFNQYLSTYTTYNHDLCINLSDTSIKGKYFPHIKRVEDLAVIRKYFPDGMKSAGSAHDEIRYNKASGKWEYSKGRLKEVDMGTLVWDGYGNTYFAATMNDMVTSSNRLDGLLCEKYPISSVSALTPDNMIDGAMLRYNKQVIIKDTAYTDAASFKASLQGVFLYYEAAEWEWVELDEADQFKDLDYQVWNAGTEKAIAEGKSAPLAADITYGFNAIGKIKGLESLVAALRAKVGI